MKKTIFCSYSGYTPAIRKIKKTGVLCTAIFILSVKALVAQQTARLNVVYEFRYIRDISQRDIPYISNMVLTLGKTTSRYCSELFYNENRASNKNQPDQDPSQISAQPIAVVSGGPLLRVGKYGIDIREEIIKDLTTQKLEVIGRVASKTYLVETDLPKIDWQLKEERKTIGKYDCQKAVGKYAGREYEAWFAPELPYHDGPWKLNGLPGLILEAHDTKNEVIFTFKEISRIDNADETIVSYLKDQSVIKANLKNYNRLRASFDTDPEGIILAEHPDAKIHVKTIDGSNTNKVVKLKKYNPIEMD
jgi:GLPGLI family protein